LPAMVMSPLMPVMVLSPPASNGREPAVLRLRPSRGARCKYLERGKPTGVIVDVVAPYLVLRVFPCHLSYSPCLRAFMLRVLFHRVYCYCVIESTPPKGHVTWHPPKRDGMSKNLPLQATTHICTTLIKTLYPTVNTSRSDLAYMQCPALISLLYAVSVHLTSRGFLW
jgi:hypothetical protein